MRRALVAVGLASMAVTFAVIPSAAAATSNSDQQLAWCSPACSWRPISRPAGPRPHAGRCPTPSSKPRPRRSPAASRSSCSPGPTTATREIMELRARAIEREQLGERLRVGRQGGDGDAPGRRRTHPHMPRQAVHRRVQGGTGQTEEARQRIASIETDLAPIDGVRLGDENVVYQGTVVVGMKDGTSQTVGLGVVSVRVGDAVAGTPTPPTPTSRPSCNRRSSRRSIASATRSQPPDADGVGDHTQPSRRCTGSSPSGSAAQRGLVA